MYFSVELINTQAVQPCGSLAPEVFNMSGSKANIGYGSYSGLILYYCVVLNSSIGFLVDDGTALVEMESVIVYAGVP